MNELDRPAALLRVAIGRPGPTVPDAESWAEWVWLARVERVVPLLYRLVDDTPTDLSDDQRADIRQLHGAAMARCVQLEHHLLHISRALAAHGIRAVALKGGATAHLDYPDPSWREVSDIDLLIDPSDRIAATEVVAREGWAQGYALPKGHHDYTHAVTFTRDRMELDLHQRIGHRALGILVPTRELLDDAVPFEVAGSTLLALSDVDRMIHSAIHALVARDAHRRLSSVADVLLAALRRPDAADAVLARAERWKVRSLVERGVLDAFAAAQADVPSAWVDAMRRPNHHRDRLVDRAYLSRWRRPIVEELAYLRLLGSTRDRYTYLRGHLAPIPDGTNPGPAGLRAQLKYVLAKLRGQGD